MTRGTVVAVAVGLLVACGSTDVEPLAPEPEVPHVGAEGQWSASSGIEQRVRRLYDACQAKRAALGEEVEDGYEGDAAMTTVALGTAIAASGAADSGGLTTTVNAETTPSDVPNQTRIGSRDIPQEPTRPSRGRRARTAADAEIARINEALQDLDAWVGAHPDPRGWAPEDREAFEQQHDDLETLCD